MQRQTYKALLEVRIQQPYSSNLQLRKKKHEGNTRADLGVYFGVVTTQFTRKWSIHTSLGS